MRSVSSLPVIPTIPSTLGHTPAVLAEMLDYLHPSDGDAILDCTFGGGGYTQAILAHACCFVWAIDRDPEAIERGFAFAQNLKEKENQERLHMLYGCFGNMQALTQKAKTPLFQGIVMDLGVSSFQLDDTQRGFSFKHDGPLDMRMGKEGPSAADLVNTAPEKELADILYYYGEERYARRIARAIVAERVHTPFTTTFQLAKLVRRIVPRGTSKGTSMIDTATRSFQGLRIAVNDELGEIERGLQQAFNLLAPHGRLVVVSFHSLEDRLVKRAMAQATNKIHKKSPLPHNYTSHDKETDVLISLTPKAIRPGEIECTANPRARSARLRAVMKGSFDPFKSCYDHARFTIPSDTMRHAS